VQRVAGGFIYSASDLHNDLECGHLTWLNRAAVLGTIARPAGDDGIDMIAQKGDAHEARYLERLRDGVRRAGHLSSHLLRRHVSRPGRFLAPRGNAERALGLELRSHRHEARAATEGAFLAPAVQL
jgi:hypothetical protein